MNGQYTRFTHDSKQSGQRFVLYPSLSREFRNGWGYVRPKIGLHYTRYILDSFAGRPGRTASRSLPIANIDTGMTFERETSLFGTAAASKP
nr:LPS assembly protein LptD [Kingella potus]